MNIYKKMFTKLKINKQNTEAKKKKWCAPRGLAVCSSTGLSKLLDVLVQLPVPVASEGEDLL